MRRRGRVRIRVRPRRAAAAVTGCSTRSPTQAASPARPAGFPLAAQGDAPDLVGPQGQDAGQNSDEPPAVWLWRQRLRGGLRAAVAGALRRAGSATVSATVDAVLAEVAPHVDQAADALTRYLRERDAAVARSVELEADARRLDWLDAWIKDTGPWRDLVLTSDHEDGVWFALAERGTLRGLRAVDNEGALPDVRAAIDAALEEVEDERAPATSPAPVDTPSAIRPDDPARRGQGGPGDASAVPNNPAAVAEMRRRTQRLRDAAEAAGALAPAAVKP